MLGLVVVEVVAFERLMIVSARLDKSARRRFGVVASFVQLASTWHAEWKACIHSHIIHCALHVDIASCMCHVSALRSHKPLEASHASK